jgi:hypothetical protein
VTPSPRALAALESRARVDGEGRRRLDDSGRDSETRAREMAQQAAGAPVTIREAIQVRDERARESASVAIDSSREISIGLD